MFAKNTAAKTTKNHHFFPEVLGSTTDRSVCLSEHASSGSDDKHGRVDRTRAHNYEGEPGVSTACSFSKKGGPHI